MASNDPWITQLEKLAEKQMKSVLHVKFLEECLSDELIPKGFEIRVKVSIGNDPEDMELQSSVDKLLEKNKFAHHEHCQRGTYEEGKKSW